MACRTVTSSAETAPPRLPLKRNQRRRHPQSAPSPLVGEGWGGGWCVSQCGASLSRPPPPTPSQPAGGLPASGKSEADQTPAGRGLVGEGSIPSLPRVL